MPIRPLSCSESMSLFIPRDEFDGALPRPMDVHGLQRCASGFPKFWSPLTYVIN
jgi:hypothetical protein